MATHDERDLLDLAQGEAEQIADQMGIVSEVDRRDFIFTSIVAAAATTFGFGAKALAQGGGGGAPGGGAPGGAGGGGGRGAQGPVEPPVPLDNMEAVSWECATG